MMKPDDMKGAAIDLGRLKPIPDDVRSQALTQAEIQSGLRCAGCGERITIGARYIGFRVERLEDGQPGVGRMTAVACTPVPPEEGGEMCMFGIELANDPNIVAVERVEYHWIDGLDDVIAHESGA